MNSMAVHPPNLRATGELPDPLAVAGSSVPIREKEHSMSGLTQLQMHAMLSGYLQRRCPSHSSRSRPQPGDDGLSPDQLAQRNGSGS